MILSEKLQQQFGQIADQIADVGFAVSDDFLDSSQVARILRTDEFNVGRLQFKKAGIGKQQEKVINESIRGDFIQWIDPDKVSEPIQAYYTRIRMLITFLNQALFLSLKDAEIHMTFYPVGTFYKRHLDQFKADDHRKLSVIFYLNEQWTAEQGGQLRLYSKKVVDVLPIAGRLVCFRSDQLEHEVLPATRERLSITGWMVDRNPGSY